MCHANPADSPFYPEVISLAEEIGSHLMPRAAAYHEIWLDKKLVGGSDEEIEPLYGKRYLPRKFKIGIVIPPQNDCDIFSQDLGFITIVEKEKITGYNVVVGGGLGSTFGIPSTYPRTGSVIGFCKPEQVLMVAEQVVAIQRDYGDRTNRKEARLKYTIDRLGLDWFKNELQSRPGCVLEAAKPFSFTRNGDNYGWKKGTDDKWHLTYFVEGGRVKNNHGSTN
jgi:sulfite reductase (NADPH) hemoprotein beta-component